MWPEIRVPGDPFGVAVAVDASPDAPYLVVGAFESDQAAEAVGAHGDGTNGTSAGAIYLFDLPDNLLNESLEVVAFDGSEFDDYGFRVSVSGNLIGAGADTADIDDVADDNAGAACTLELPEPSAGLLAATALAGLGPLRARRRRAGREP